MIGALIKVWRVENRYGVRATAKMIGVSSATLSRIENGMPMDQRSMLLMLAWLFGPTAPEAAAKEHGNG